jgi:hypothetical protein
MLKAGRAGILKAERDWSLSRIGAKSTRLECCF